MSYCFNSKACKQHSIYVTRHEGVCGNTLRDHICQKAWLVYLEAKQFHCRSRRQSKLMFQMLSITEVTRHFCEKICWYYTGYFDVSKIEQGSCSTLSQRLMFECKRYFFFLTIPSQAAANKHSENVYALHLRENYACRKSKVSEDRAKECCFCSSMQ